MWQCQRQYCPHVHEKKCLNGRLKDIIPYTIFPIRTIDSFTNVHIRCTNPKKTNVSTGAYQTYMFSTNQQNEDDQNFVKNYYLQNCKNQPNRLINNIVDDYEEKLACNSAYVLANVENQKYLASQQKRIRQLENARRRSVSRYNNHLKAKQLQEQNKRNQNAKWLKKLYRKLQQVAQHIISGEGQDIEGRQRMFLLSKGNLTAGYLSNIKVRSPQVAFQIMQQIRTLMLKKKLKFEDKREEQQNNKSVSVSFASETSQNVSQGSMLSQASSIGDSRADAQQQMVGKFCNFEQLKKKWRLDDIEQVKDMIKRMLTRQVVSEAQVRAVKNRKSAEKINQKLQSQQKSKSTIKKPNSIVKKFQNKQQQKKIVPITSRQLYENLNKQEINVKQALIKGGQFDAIGEVYSRNKNFSDLFKKRQEVFGTNFTFKQQNNTTLSLNKDSITKNR